MKYLYLLITVQLIAFGANAQKAILKGQVKDQFNPIPFATISVDGTSQGTVTDNQGKFSLQLEQGTYILNVSMLGYASKKLPIDLTKGSIDALDIVLETNALSLEQVVVTGTRTTKKITDTPIAVDIISSETLTNTQSCNLSEGLRFQPGLRVENDCQTCNYTQLRMNGLGGGYSQILINGRPVFSPLTGLYGMEQIPTDMIGRIEIVRGGGSALYGSSAIGGTVNVITKLPQKSGYNLAYTYQNIDGANDHILSGNASAVNELGNAGVTFFVNRRSRDFYDANGDNFSELPLLENNSFGASLFYKPSENQKIEMSVSSLNEYRFGGEMVEKAAHLTQQAEERTHRVLMANVDYQLNFNDNNSNFIAYLAAQHTDREHYTGLLPDEATELENHLLNPPYGNSDNSTWQAGLQLNHYLKNFLGGNNVLTLGTEYIEDDVLDVIEAYNFEIDQTTRNLGVFMQSDWEINSALTLLSGVRLDQHNFVSKPIISPRVSLMYKFLPNTQFRATWGTGFRAPQAFDADMHIAFAGGGISRISLAEDLQHERSNSISTSINFDKPTDNYIFGFTIEGFYTRLRDAFFLAPLGEDTFGERFEKQNGDGATVQGVTLEARANYQQKVQLEAGFTLQTSLFDTPVENIDGLESKREFLRTPNEYGYATFTYTPDQRFNTSVNIVYTGSMELAHFGGAPEQPEDAYKVSPAFTEIGLRMSYLIPIKNANNGLELFGGIKNITNAYQSDFDTGKNRDSNYVYGPAAPRTFFVGLRLKSL